MWEKLLQAWKIKEVRNGLLFVIAMMALFRVTAHIPLPGVDALALQNFFAANQVLGLLSLFSGGTLESFSVVALGIAPYITASIVIQLMGMMIPKIEEIQKDGEQGRAKINQWTRLLTVPFAIIQAFGLLSLLRSSGTQILTRTDALHLITLIATVTAGAVFLVWIGELISERKVGNGISLLIFAGIVAGLPQIIQQAFVTYDSSQLMSWIAYAAVAVATIVGVVFISEGQRNIPVQYARQVRGMGSSGGASSHLPLRVNMAGVIPIIFAVSFLLFPSVIGQFFSRARTQWVADAANWMIVTLQNQGVYAILYFLLVVGFTFFYASIIFKPDQIAENLQKQGGFIPGIRPGTPTSSYLTSVLNRITLAGSLFLGVIAVMPVAIQAWSGNTQFVIGGTSLLIIVSVVIETVKQIESQATMREYDVY